MYSWVPCNIREQENEWHNAHENITASDAAAQLASGTLRWHVERYRRQAPYELSAFARNVSTRFVDAHARTPLYPYTLPTCRLAPRNSQ